MGLGPACLWEKWMKMREPIFHKQLVNGRVLGQMWLEICSCRRLTVGWSVICNILCRFIHLQKMDIYYVTYTEVMFWLIGRWIKRSLHFGQIMFEPSFVFSSVSTPWTLTTTYGHLWTITSAISGCSFQSVDGCWTAIKPWASGLPRCHVLSSVRPIGCQKHDTPLIHNNPPISSMFISSKHLESAPIQH